MRTIFIIIHREYLTRIRQKSFVVTTFAGPVALLLLTFLSFKISSYSESVKTINIIDEGNILNKTVLPDKEDHTLYFRYSSLSKDGFLKSKNNNKTEDALFLIIPAADTLKLLSDLHIQYFGDKQLGRVDKEYVQKVISEKLQLQKLKSFNHSQEEIDNWEIHTQLEYLSTKTDLEDVAYNDVASAIGLLTGLVIYIMLIFYGVTIMRGVMEEKTTRIIEVIISSVKPFQLLLAKIIGIGLVGITQFIIWVLLILMLNIFLLPIIGLDGSHVGAGNPMLSMKTSAIDLDYIQSLSTGFAKINFVKMFFTFLVYFIGGYFLYGSLFAGLGATVNEEGETQSISMIVTIPIMASFFISTAVINDPSSSLAVWASIFPLTSPVVMPVRMAFNPPLYQVFISVAILFATFIGSTWVAARIYRTGILMYGKKATLKDISKWFFYKD
jgi:ABC-2 type transport system permease protein